MHSYGDFIIRVIAQIIVHAPGDCTVLCNNVRAVIKVHSIEGNQQALMNFHVLCLFVQ